MLSSTISLAPFESRRPTEFGDYADDYSPMTPVPPDFLVPLLARPVAILGGGVSGQAVRELLALLQ